MATCAIKWCGKSTRTSGYQKDGITFHRFPKCPIRKSKWIDATCRGEKWFPSQRSLICSRHFTEDNFHKMKDRRRLMDTAVPTLCLPLLSSGTKDTENNCEKTSAVSEFDETSTKSESIPRSSPQDPMLSSPDESQSEVVLLPPIPNSPFTNFDTLTERRLRKRIVELENRLQIKNKLIKKLNDSNRRLKSCVQLLQTKK